MQILEFVKEHPIPVGIGVVIIVLLLSRSSSGSASVSNSAAIGAAAQASAQQANVQLAGLSANTAVALGAQNVTNKQTAENAATARMGVAAGFLSSIASLGASSVMNDSNNTLKLVLGSQATQIQQQTLENDLAVKTDAINANIKMNADKLKFDFKSLVENNNARLNQIGATTQGSVAVIQAGGAVQSGLLGQQLAFQDKNLSAILQHGETLATINGQNQLAITQAQQAAALATANAQAGAIKTQSQQSWITTVADVFGSFF